MYRILEAFDGIHWTDNKKNNRKDPSLAVMEINQYASLNPFGKWKLVNVKTKQIIYEKGN